MPETQGKEDLRDDPEKSASLQNPDSQSSISNSEQAPATAIEDASVDMNAPGFARRLLIAGVNVLMVLSLVALALIAWLRLPAFLERLEMQTSVQAEAAMEPAPEVEETRGLEDISPQEIELVPITFENSHQSNGVLRKPMLFTIIPSRPRVNVITYTVETGDSLFSIADNFNLKPETILWGNFDTLEDNPHLLSTGQVLNILPTDGTYYQWNQGDSIAQVASFFQVEPGAILDYTGNTIDLTTAENSDPGILAGTWLIVPGGRRPLKDWGPPAISRSNPASARYYGDGYCGSVYEGAIGTGTFVWPTPARSISGYGYSGIHPAIDIAGAVGNAVFAADSGVVVFAGWSNFGYGYMVVIDHGNGWQTAYAHLSAVGVTCGQSVFQGGYIGAVGSTGNSTGSHLHFELVYNGAKPNPLDYLQ